MRTWTATLLGISTAVALFLSLWYVQQHGDDDLDPPVDVVAPPERVSVRFAERENLEVMVRPYYFEESRNDFNAERLNKMMTDGRQHYSYLRIWVVNHGQKSRRVNFAELASLSLEISAGKSLQARPLGLVLAESEKKLNAADEMVVQRMGLPDSDILAAGQFLEFVVAVASKNLVLADCLAVTVKWAEILPLVPAEARRSDLDQYWEKPQGKLGSRLIVKKDKPVAEHASRK